MIQVNKNKVAEVASSAFAQTGSMADGRFWHSATLLGDGRVLVVGGVTATRRHRAPIR